MAGDGPLPIKRKLSVESDLEKPETDIAHEKQGKETGSDSNYHALSGVMMPKFLNGPPRIGLSKNRLCKPLHKKPKFMQGVTSK